MTFPEEAQHILDKIVDTSQAQDALRAGYMAGIDLGSDARLGSSHGTPNVVVDARGAAVHSWTEDKEVASNDNSVLIDDPAFVLGAALGMLSKQRKMEKL